MDRQQRREGKWRFQEEAADEKREKNWMKQEYEKIFMTNEKEDNTDAKWGMGR